VRACIQRTTHGASSSTTKRRRSTPTSTSTLTTIDEHNDYMTVVLTFVPDQHSVGRVSLFAS
jgi:hypothetical protein